MAGPSDPNDFLVVLHEKLTESPQMAQPILNIVLDFIRRETDAFYRIYDSSAALDDRVERPVCRSLTSPAVRSSTSNTKDQSNAGDNTNVGTPPVDEMIDLRNVESPPTVIQGDDDVAFVTAQQYDVSELPVPRLRASRSLPTLNQRDRSRSPLYQSPTSSTHSIAIEQNQPTKSIAVPAPPPVNKRRVLKCPICLNRPNLPTATICGHVFCNTCICMTLRVSHKCPTCKRRQVRTLLRRLYVQRST